MPIKAGDLSASAPGQLPTMVSDGRRMRVLWQQSHGNGDPSRHLIERCLSSVKGHPTWKLFCDIVPNPIVRGTNEPPRHVYLDDRACYSIWASEQYTKHELRDFWPFDFDNIGKIKTSRPNRGRPAYLDDSCTNYAKVTLRDKKKLYVFCGTPDYMNYISPCSGLPEVEFMAPSLDCPPLDTSATPSRPGIKPGTGHIPFEPISPKRYIPGPTDGNPLPLGMVHKAVGGSPYFDNPTAMYRLKPRPRAGDLADLVGTMKKSKDEGADLKDKQAETRKREVGIEDVSDDREAKRLKM